MNLLHTPASLPTHRFPCPGCGTGNFLPVVTLIRTEEELDAFFAGNTNRGTCVSCGGYCEAPVPVRVSLPELPWLEHQFVPFADHEDPWTLEELLHFRHGNPACKIVHSLAELERSILFLLALDAHREKRIVRLRDIVIPPDVAVRIAGSYKKNKLKVIWFVSTFFPEESDHTVSDCHHIIHRALSRLDQWAANLETTHIFSALRELGFLRESPDGLTYRKISPVPCDQTGPHDV